MYMVWRKEKDSDGERERERQKKGAVERILHIFRPHNKNSAKLYEKNGSKMYTINGILVGSACYLFCAAEFVWRFYRSHGLCACIALFCCFWFHRNKMIHMFWLYSYRRLVLAASMIQTNPIPTKHTESRRSFHEFHSVWPLLFGTCMWNMYIFCMYWIRSILAPFNSNVSGL